MIPAITEVNFPSYATLHQATVSLQDMGDRVISTQVRIDGDVVPDFSGWELRFKGERFVLPSDNPQAMKDNTTRNSLVDLQFQSWVIQELKRYYFFEAASVSAGVAIADKYVAPVRLNVEDFVAMLNDVLDYYFDGKIVADLYLSGTGIYSQEKKDMEINYSYLWEVVGKVFEVYGVRNVIEYDSTNDVYTIKFGYPADEIDDHTFEYGYQGGLLKFERQVQDETISNILLGRGGEKNIPYRYFKAIDPQNPEWAADPDAIPELANIYFDRLRDINFRRYVQGWRTNPNRDTSWEAVQAYDATRGATDWAYKKGHEDERFSPVEYVKDDESIAAYGEHWGALDDNDEIYPTIQGRNRTGLGRIDEVVAVSPIITDDIQAMAQASAVEKSISSLTVSKYGSTETTHTIESEEFTIPDGSTGNITYAWVDKATLYAGNVYCDTVNSSLVAVSSTDGTELPISGIPAGTYRLRLRLVIRIDSPATSATGTFGIENIVLTTSAQDAEAWKPTFDIWVKDIWGIEREQGESDVQYAMRVWEPILGDRVGNEAKVVFSTGFMAVSEDYEFTIADYPVPDTTKTLNGVPSAWRITLRKSDAEYDATGLYIPNNSTGGKPIAGDKFFFTGIDMPHLYVTLAEEELNTFKSAQLQGTSAVNPTWVISLDKVRVHTLEDGEYGQTLAERLAAGAKLRVTDPRFSGGDILTLYAQSVTYTWNEPSDGSPYLVPDIEVVLSDQVVSRESRVDKIQSSVEQIKSQYARIDDVESVVRKVAEPMFLKKTGEADSSESPTQFSSKVTSRGFRQGGVGGTGWGFYRDNTEQFQESGTPVATRSRSARAVSTEIEEGDSVLEVDRVVVRKEMKVNSLVVNQVEYRGGMEIISAAKIEISKVIDDDANGVYICYFDQRQNSVANNFQVGDVAYGHVFTPNDSTLRYYKCRVVGVDVDRIMLSKTVKDGAGVPQAGDVVVQFGSYTSSARRYVIVRDVVGGGYEQMLSGLDSVTASGEEYYYAGRTTGQNPRWFVGDSDGEYAEWKNGVLNIKGRLTVLNSQGSYVAMDSYMNAVTQQFQEQQAQIDGQTQSWASGEAPSAQTKPYPLWDDEAQQVVGTPNFPYTQWADDTERAKHVGDTYVDDTTGQSYRLTKKTSGGTTVYYWTRITDEEVSQAISTSQQAYAAAEGLQYLKAATNEGTLVDGGLVLTSMIQLGYTPQGGSYTVMSGINGKPNTQLQDPAKSIAAWFGGAMVDHETYPAVSDYAKSLFRMDGSGYLASGNIGWQADGDGHIPGISWETVGGVTSVTIGANVKLEQTGGTDSSVTDLVSAVQSFPSVYLSKTDAATLYHPKGGDTASNTFKIGGATLTWHPESSAGAGDAYLELDTALVTLGDQIVGSGTPGGGGGGDSKYLNDLLDVTITNPSNGQALVYQNGEWINGTVQSGSVTSVGLSMPTGFSVASSPVTSSGTLAVSFASGYSIPTTAKQNNWDTAYGWGNHANAGYLLASDAANTYQPIIPANTYHPYGGGNINFEAKAVTTTGNITLQAADRSILMGAEGSEAVVLRRTASYLMLGSGTYTSLPTLIYGTPIRFHTYETTAAERMRILANGRVAINSTTSSYQLYVNGTLGVSGLSTLTGGATIPATASLKIGDATITWVPPADASTPGYLKINSALLTDGDQIVGSGTPGGGGGGAGYLYELGDVYSVNNAVARADGTGKHVGDVLQYLNATKGWVAVAASSIGRIYEEGTGITIGNDNKISVTANTYAPYNSAGYLPLSGGTLSSSLVYSLSLNNEASGATIVGIRFRINSTEVGNLYVTSTHGLFFYDTTSYRTVLHSGNSGISSSAVTLNDSSVGTESEPIGYSLYTSRFKRYEGTAAEGGYDLDTMLQGGGITSQYNSRYYWSHGPTDMTYGGVVQFNPNTSDTLALQIAWDIVHDTSSPDSGNLWFRDKTAVNGGTWGGWKQIWHSGNLTKSVLTGLLDASGGYYLPLTGGTISGTGNINLTINNSGTGTSSYIRFNVGGVNKAYVGFDGTAGAILQNYAVSGYPYVNIASDGVFKYKNTYTFYHSGNSNLTSINWSAKSLTLAGAITGATTGAFSSNVTVGGTLGVTGATTLSSTLTTSGDILPSANNSYNLGSESNSWVYAYVTSVVPMATWGYLYNNTKNGGWRFYTTTNDDTPATQEVLRLNPNKSSNFYGDLSVSGSTYRTTYDFHNRADSRIYVWGNTTSTASIAFRIYQGNYLQVGSGTYATIPTYIYGNYLRFFTYNDSAGVEAIRIINNGNVGIGTTSPAYKLDVAGVVRASRFITGATASGIAQYAGLSAGNQITGSLTINDGAIYYSGYKLWVWATEFRVFGDIVSTGDQVISSDINLKKNIKDLDLTVEQIAQLPAVTFDWKDGRGSTFGTVAQGVLPIFPQAVRGNEGNYSVVYGQGGWVFGVKNARAIVDIQAHETEQDKEIRKLKARVRDLEKQLQTRS